MYQQHHVIQIHVKTAVPVRIHPMGVTIADVLQPGWATTVLKVSNPLRLFAVLQICN